MFLIVGVILQEVIWYALFGVMHLTLIFICSLVLIYLKMEGLHSPTLFRDWGAVFKAQSLGEQLYLIIHYNTVLWVLARLAIFGEFPSRKTRFRNILSILREKSSSFVENQNEVK